MKQADAACTWARARGRALLAVPGPTELPEAVLGALSRPAVVHYGSPYDEGELDPLLLAARALFQTESDTVLLPGSGRTALEAGIASCIEAADRVLVLVVGRFGRLLAAMCETSGARCRVLEVPEGGQLDVTEIRRVADDFSPTVIAAVHNETSTGCAYPLAEVGLIAREHDALLIADTVSSLGGIDIPTDRWFIDVNMAASHKCIGGPLGLALLAVGPRAWRKMENRRSPISASTLNLLRWRREWLPGAGTGERGRRQPVSLPTHLVAALGCAVRLALDEGLEHRFLRHQLAAHALRAGLAGLGLESFGAPEVRSDTVCCFHLPRGIDSELLMIRMRDHYGISIAPGIGRNRASTARVGVMGVAASPLVVLGVLSALELALCDSGAAIPVGAGVAAAQRSFGGAK